MDSLTLDRRTPGTGGRFVSPAIPPIESEAAPPCTPEALLALADGSLWRGRSVGSPGPVAGTVRIAGDLVLVEGDSVVVLRDVEPVTPGLEIRAALAAISTQELTCAQGFAAAAGATLPLHATVACAIARGEIGRP